MLMDDARACMSEIVHRPNQEYKIRRHQALILLKSLVMTDGQEVAKRIWLDFDLRHRCQIHEHEFLPWEHVWMGELVK